MAFQSGSSSGFSFGGSSSSLFGSSSQPMLFGSTTNASSGGLFGATPSSSSSLFGSGSTPAPTFGTPASTSLFASSASAPTFRAAPTATPGTSSSIPMPASSAFPPFGSSTANNLTVAAPSSSLFGLSAPTSSSLFGAVQSGAAPGPSPFGNASTPAPEPASGSLFVTSGTPAQSLFATPSSSPLASGGFQTAALGASASGTPGTTAFSSSLTAVAPKASAFGTPVASVAQSTDGSGNTPFQSATKATPSLSSIGQPASQQAPASAGFSFLPSTIPSSAQQSSGFSFSPSNTNTTPALPEAPSTTQKAGGGASQGFNFSSALGSTPSASAPQSSSGFSLGAAPASAQSLFSSPAAIPSITGSSQGFSSFGSASASSASAPGTSNAANAANATKTGLFSNASGVSTSEPSTSAGAATKSSAGSEKTSTAPSLLLTSSALGTTSTGVLGSASAAAQVPSLGLAASSSNALALFGGGSSAGVKPGQTQGQGAQGKAEPLSVPSDIKDLSLDEVVNKWTEEVADLAEQFQRGAALVSKWDRAIVANEDKIVTLHKDAQALQIAHKELSNNLDVILSQQTELHSLLDALEADVDRKIGNVMMKTDSRSTYRTSSKLYGDAERESMHRLSLEIMQELDAMALTLRDLVLELNRGRSSARGDGGAGDTVSQIVSVLNAHLDSLQYLDESSNSLQKRLADVSRACEVIARESDRMYVRRPDAMY